MTLFSIQMRIAEELLDLPVMDHDSSDTLLDRLCNHQAVKREFRKILKTKLVDSLDAILNNNTLDQQLREKVEGFLNQGRGQLARIENRHTQGYKVASQNLNKNRLNTESDQTIVSDTDTIPKLLTFSVPKEKRLLEIHELNRERCNKDHDPNKDIIVAYENVYNKCRDPELKGMARRALNSFGQRTENSANKFSHSASKERIINPERSFLSRTPLLSKQLSLHQLSSHSEWKSGNSAHATHRQPSSFDYSRSPLKNKLRNPPVVVSDSKQHVRGRQARGRGERRFRYLNGQSDDNK